MTYLANVFSLEQEKSCIVLKLKLCQQWKSVSLFCLHVFHKEKKPKCVDVLKSWHYSGKN